MKKTIRLNESQLNSLIKRIIKEVEEESQNVDQITPDETSEFERELKQIDYQLASTNLGSVSDIVSSDEPVKTDIDQEFQQKLAEKKLTSVYEKNKSMIDSQISGIKQIAGKYDLCTRDGRKQAKKEIREKIFNLIRKIKDKKVNEQILPGVLLSVGWILVAFLLLFWRRIIYGDNCRRWTRAKRRMVGY